MNGTHWLVRPKTIRWIWRIFIAVLALTVLAQLGVHIHPHFEVDAWFAFYAVYGFGTCVIMIVGAKLLGVVLKRKDTYYDD